MAAAFVQLPADPDGLRRRLLAPHPRLLLFGPPGAGKSTLAEALGRAAADEAPHCLGADPGSPAFGVPGAACLGRWQDGWRPLALEGLCSLNAARFRLPLVEAVRRLTAEAPAGPLLIDGPGVVRGVAGAELLAALVEAAAADAVLAVCPDPAAPPLAPELAALGRPVYTVAAAGSAHRPGKAARARDRTGLWDRYLAGAEERSVAAAAVTCIGTPPPADTPAAWAGRQVAILEGGRTVALGEVLAREAGTLRLRLPPHAPEPRTVLVRDAVRTADGRLNTAAPFATGAVQYLPPPDVVPYPGGGPSGPQPVARVGPGTAILLNGVFGDPLLHLRLRHARRSLLFDLGEATRLPARIAHQVSDVFISHAHIDHIGGFLWLLRSRIGDFPPLRLYGPPGLIANLNGMLQGVLWDRIGERGPRFEVTELHPDTLRRARLQAGHTEPQPLPAMPCEGGLLLEETGFRVRAAVLDHGAPAMPRDGQYAGVPGGSTPVMSRDGRYAGVPGSSTPVMSRDGRYAGVPGGSTPVMSRDGRYAGVPGGSTPVLAYAFEPALQINVRKERLAARGLAPGPWLATLKERIAAGEETAELTLPDGSRERVGALAAELTLIRPGQTLVYATDLADTTDNRHRLTALAAGAHTLFCEAAFTTADAEQAARTGHLTARACGEIATAADVTHLVPFHFSRRYEAVPGQVYAEVAAACSRVVVPALSDTGPRVP